MSTFSEMVTEVMGHLRAYTRNQELSSHLTLGINSSVKVIPVADATLISRGRVQIGDELIWVDSTDRQAGELSIPPYGRGMDGTVAAAHAAGDRIVVQPLYPNKVVKNRINQVITSLAGRLYSVATIQIDASTDSASYELPADCRQVVAVTQQWVVSGSSFSEHVRRWRFDPSSQVGVSTTGKALLVYEPFPSECKLNITFLKDPSPLTDTQSFADSGLPDSAEDVVILGAAASLLSGTSVGMTNSRTVEANTLDSKIQPSVALQQARYLQTLYAQRLQDEELKLSSSYSIRSHYSG